MAVAIARQSLAVMSGSALGRRSYQWPWMFSLRNTGQVQEQLLFMVAANDLKSNGQTVKEARWNSYRGIAGEVGGNGENSVVADGFVEAMLGHQIDGAHGSGHRSGRRKGYVGIRRGEDEVSLFKDVGHLFIEVNSEHLGCSGTLKAESLRRHTHSELNLGRQVIVAGWIPIT
jgi:hypothetical protein